jgi:hypothetical protein
MLLVCQRHTEVSFYASLSMIRETLKFSYHEASGEWLKIVKSIDLSKERIKEKILYL